MMRSTINHVVTTPPEPGRRLQVVRLNGTDEMDLRDLYRYAGRVALHLRGLGVRAGDRIGILAANCLEWVLLDLAALRLKVVTAGFEPGKFEPEADLLARYGLTLLYTDRPAEVPGVRPVDELRRLADLPDQPLPPVSYAPQDVTTLKFTSGSTGQPKGLAATVGSIDSSLDAVQQMFGHGPGDNLFVLLPLSLLQQRYWVYSALCHGHDVTITTYEAAFAALPRVEPTVVMGVPGFYESAKTHIQARATRAGIPVSDAARELFGSRIRYLWTGSAPAGMTMLRFFTDAGMPIYEGYGLNETCIVSKNHPGACKQGSVGRVLPGKQVLFEDNGLISVRSDHPVNIRYEYAAPGESERVFGPDGVVRTGDLGYLDEDGFLFVRGRADDVIVLTNGRNVVVGPIEERVNDSPAVGGCVLFAPTGTHLVAVVSPARLPVDEAAITAAVASANAGSGPDEQIRRVIVAREPFSIENGLLTSQYKPRRWRILDAYRSEIHQS